MMNAEALIAAALAAPKTHAVVTTYVGGATRTRETRSLASAENYAHHERRRIGRALIARDPVTLQFLPDTVCAASVSVGTIEQGQVAVEYAECIGYDPFADDAAMTVEEARQTLAEWRAEGSK